MNKRIECPECTSNTLAVERRPNGNAKCMSCFWQGPYKDCVEKTEAKPQSTKLKSEPRETWILKTPGGEFLYFEEPISYDWKICSKKQLVEKSFYDKLREENESLKNEIEALREGMDKVFDSHEKGYTLLVTDRERAFNEADRIRDERAIK